MVKHIRNYSRHMSGQLKSRTFNPADPITVLTFMTDLAVACNHEKISEGNGMWMFQFFMRDPARAALSARLAPKRGS